MVDIILRQFCLAVLFLFFYGRPKAAQAFFTFRSSQRLLLCIALHWYRLQLKLSSWQLLSVQRKAVIGTSSKQRFLSADEIALLNHDRSLTWDIYRASCLQTVIGSKLSTVLYIICKLHWEVILSQISIRVR